MDQKQKEFLASLPCPVTVYIMTPCKKDHPGEAVRDIDGLKARKFHRFSPGDDTQTACGIILGTYQNELTQVVQVADLPADKLCRKCFKESE